MDFLPLAFEDNKPTPSVTMEEIVQVLAQLEKMKPKKTILESFKKSKIYKFIEYKLTSDDPLDEQSYINVDNKDSP